MSEFDEKIRTLKDGSYDVIFENRRYLLSKSTHLNAKLIKLYAKELGGNDFISLNYYRELEDGLKPCEMPKEKVISFVLGCKI